MINKKGEFLARDYVIIGVLFGTICLLFFLVVGDFSENYNVPNMTDSKFQLRYDTLTESTSNIYKMQNSSSSSEGLSTISTFTYIFKSTFSIISIIFSGIGMVSETFSNFAEDFGVPSPIANIIFPAVIVIIVALLVFVIISSVSQGKI